MNHKNTSKLQQRDLNHIWHPCSQMKDYEDFPPIEIVKARGSYLIQKDGSTLIDAMSSWWCKSLGHHHPRLLAALREQMEEMEHVILANTTNRVVVELSERLSQLCPSLNKVMYASDGSCAVEMALKMSLHSRRLQNQPERTQFMGLENGYHGETSLALAVSDCGIYRKDYEAILPTVPLLSGIPYVQSESCALWQDCSSHWPDIEAQLEQHKETLTAIIFEPIVQGAGGMLMYSKDFLKRLRTWCDANDVHMIADEIMTGFGRTGFALACEHAEIEPDFLCLAKGLTAGVLPLSAMVTSDKLYDLFYDDYEKGKSFLHSHTHTGNALACAVALATLDVYEDDNIYQQTRDNSHYMFENMMQVSQQTERLQNIRYIGGMIAADLITEKNRAGYDVYQNAISLGALLRPLGNTIYWLPPLNSSRQTLDELADITCEAIKKTAL